MSERRGPDRPWSAPATSLHGERKATAETLYRLDAILGAIANINAGHWAIETPPYPVHQGDLVGVLAETGHKEINELLGVVDPRPNLSDREDDDTSDAA